ncbi:hypothetical protein BC835DRAFT_1433046 [Cytidiella melzeri]|nr:hypothetical protein BC835DRAFT_1433046 [Cytidiella melzeri]
MSTLLSFHKSILEKIHDPSTSEFVLLARGLGLRRIVCKLLQIYDSPQNLIILVNASSEEEAAIGEELGVLGCRNPGLRIVGFETNKRERQDLYKRGGLVSVTSQILTVDMLVSDIPTHLITGILMLHSERVSPSSSETFIVRLYREKNKTGFLKAFSDQPEHITSGLSPLRTILKELHLRTVHIYPRCAHNLLHLLGKPDMLYLTIDMTEYMSAIHNAIVQCMSTTLSELKRSNSTLDLDDINVENAYFRSFDVVVRRQLDPVWHKVGPKTKQLVNDLATLRRLLGMLLTHDAIAFQQYLEGLLESNTVNDSGKARQHQSPWLLTDAANTVFQYAKRRCYVTSKATGPMHEPFVIDVDEDDDDAWEALLEAEGATGKIASLVPTKQPKRPAWLPAGMEPVLEELPKWSLVAAALQEIEEEMVRREAQLTSRDPGKDLVLIMTSSLRTSELLGEFLDDMDPDAAPGAQGRAMMEKKLRWYIHRWQRRQTERKLEARGRVGPLVPEKSASLGVDDGDLSEALKKKDQARQAHAANRRRMRGGAPVPPPTRKVGAGTSAAQVDDVDQLATFFAQQDDPVNVSEDVSFIGFGDDFNDNYGLVSPEETVVVRSYSDDSDDQTLSELQPRYIIMFEPNLDFVRRIEVYKKSNPGLGVRVYLMIYNTSCEEAKYLAGVRREKDAFERLIKERGSMLMPILDERHPGSTGDAIIKTISSRLAGGRKEINAEPSRVIVDMREFRSSLPSLLHASDLLVIPATLTVGDYILTPNYCVERKSIPDLISSFNSGRLYTQCELMSAHYKHPILLIEWEEHKSFSLESIADTKSYVKATAKYPAKKNKQPNANEPAVASPNIQSKLVLLTLTFPRVRIIWSSSPYATADIFNDLKTNNPEPDPMKAITTGAEDDSEAGAGINATAEELLRALPGVTGKNVKHVTSKVGSVREFCELSLTQMQEILGVEPGRSCWDFIHKGERQK